jgi:hypothetical protein
MDSKSDVAGDLGAGFAANQPIVAPSQFAFAGFRILLVQDLSDREAQNAIADKFEAFVVEARDLAAANARMCQRLLQKVGVFEAMSKFGFKLFKLASSQHGVDAA